jgi:hypothetical protein
MSSNAPSFESFLAGARGASARPALSPLRPFVRAALPAVALGAVMISLVALKLYLWLLAH